MYMFFKWKAKIWWLGKGDPFLTRLIDLRELCWLRESGGQTGQCGDSRQSDKSVWADGPDWVGQARLVKGLKYKFMLETEKCLRC